MASASPPLIAGSDHTLSTLPDPRMPVSPSGISRSASTSTDQPQLSDEIATLSKKLVHAINHQTDLDDTLTITRRELQSAREQIQRLQADAREYRSMTDNRILVKWADVEKDVLRLRKNLADERTMRVQAEKGRRSMEVEVENLTTALFEEANQMVASARQEARKEKDLIERKNEQLQAQVFDAEALLASHQEQLAELKMSIQTLSRERKEYSHNLPTPKLDSLEEGFLVPEILHKEQALAEENDLPSEFIGASAPAMPSVRRDTQAFEDFQILLETFQISRPTSRVSSGNFGGMGASMLRNPPRNDQEQNNARHSSNGSDSPLTASYVGRLSPPFTSNQHTPAIPTKDVSVSATSLKDTAFYKRILNEDVEPTLRLDAAPGLSWLARRSVINSICEGRFIVEPMATASTRASQPSCALCGERRSSSTHTRKHIFRINDNDSAQRYPLCEYCVKRVRSTCDFLGFLRMIRDGTWRVDNPNAEITAWEESVHLREGMFWARLGRNAIPPQDGQRNPESPTPFGNSHDPTMPDGFAPKVEGEGENHDQLEKLSGPQILPKSFGKPADQGVNARQGTSLACGAAEALSPKLRKEDEIEIAEAQNQKALGAENGLSFADEKRPNTSGPIGAPLEEKGRNGKIINSISKRAAMFEVAPSATLK